MRAGQLVVATPQLLDPHFARSVVLLLQADSEDGALGVVLNRPTGTELAEVLPSWADLSAAPPLVFSGGPVSPSAAICLGHARAGGRSAAYSAIEGMPAGSVGTVDLDARPEEVQRVVTEVRVFAGYAGWSPGQLESEVEEGGWWVLDSLPDDAFSPRPERLWHQVLYRQGPPIAFAASFPSDPTLN
ncbi:MAG: hypothetical protein JWN88_557 [Frankiales bacterium]|jgi:putative transcriptional regulator|nr:hypothetical protein [Frankiales bacterium]